MGCLGAGDRRIIVYSWTGKQVVWLQKRSRRIKKSPHPSTGGVLLGTQCGRKLNSSCVTSFGDV